MNEYVYQDTYQDTYLSHGEQQTCSICLQKRPTKRNIQKRPRKEADKRDLVSCRRTINRRMNMSRHISRHIFESCECVLIFIDLFIICTLYLLFAHSIYYLHALFIIWVMWHIHMTQICVLIYQDTFTWLK